MTDQEGRRWGAGRVLRWLRGWEKAPLVAGEDLMGGSLADCCTAAAGDTGPAVAAAGQTAALHHAAYHNIISKCPSHFIYALFI